MEFFPLDEKMEASSKHVSGYTSFGCASSPLSSVVCEGEDLEGPTVVDDERASGSMFKLWLDAVSLGEVALDDDGDDDDNGIAADFVRPATNIVA